MARYQQSEVTVKTDRQPTVRAINSHVFAGTGYCYVTLPDDKRSRIGHAKSIKGALYGRVIGFGYALHAYELIPLGSAVELS